MTRVAAKAIAGTAVNMLSIEGIVDEALASFEEQKRTVVLWEPNYAS